MRLWKVWFVVTNKPLRQNFLGRVRAKHQPDAMLKAFKKFKLTTNNEQLHIRVE